MSVCRVTGQQSSSCRPRDRQPERRDRPGQVVWLRLATCKREDASHERLLGGGVRRPIELIFRRQL